MLPPICIAPVCSQLWDWTAKRPSSDPDLNAHSGGLIEAHMVLS